MHIPYWIDYSAAKFLSSILKSSYTTEIKAPMFSSNQHFRCAIQIQLRALFILGSGWWIIDAKLAHSKVWPGYKKKDWKRNVDKKFFWKARDAKLCCSGYASGHIFRRFCSGRHQGQGKNWSFFSFWKWPTMKKVNERIVLSKNINFWRIQSESRFKTTIKCY